MAITSRQRHFPVMTIRIALLASALAIAGGCATQQGRWTRAEYELSYVPPAAESGLVDVSARIYLVSDNQRHELLGNGVELFRNSIADKYAKVAIRPPQLDHFGQDLLREALAMTDGFVLHLGDACDISNTGEFGRFAWDMRNAPQGWVMAPGNHDGYFFGNSSRTLPGLIQEWNEAAESYEFDGSTITSRAMQKDRYVSYYIAALILQEATWSGPLAHSLGPDVEEIYLNSAAQHAPDSFPHYWKALVALQEEIYALADTSGDDEFHAFELRADLAPANQPYLRRVAWHIDKKNVWQSFVLQEVDISDSSPQTGRELDPISILVLDTSQYGIQPSLDYGAISAIPHKVTGGYFDLQVAGETGGFLDSQEAALEAFAKSIKEDGGRWMLASHHPYDSLGRNATPRFDRYRDAGGIPVTLSAHTHTGEIRWNQDGSREGDWLEINVGSVLDSPVEFRDLQIHQLEERLAVSSNRYLLEDILGKQGLIADDITAYRPVRGDPDFYLNYENDVFGTEEEADFRVKRVLLAAYLRMLRLFKADHPDQGSTYWPKGPNEVQLRSHEEVTGAVERTLTEARIDDVATLTQFLYELREFDRTRKFSAAAAEQLRAYRLSQAIWAGHVESVSWGDRTVAVDPDISFLMLPSR